MTVDSVIEVIHVSVGDDGPVFHHPRNLIIAEDGAHATVVEHYIGFGQTPTLANVATEVGLGEGARIRHCKVQAEAPDAFHIAMLDARLAKTRRSIPSTSPPAPSFRVMRSG